MTYYGSDILNYCQLIWEFYRIENKNNNMNENIDLTEILKDCPKGTKFYTSIFGEVEFDSIDDDKIYPINIRLSDNNIENLTADGKLYEFFDGECILFPSREQRSWSKFTAPCPKKERFDPKTLKPFDKVLVRDFFNDEWVCDCFSNISKTNKEYPYSCIAYSHKMCIPYNEDTKYLLGINDEAPEYYRYWED